MRKSLITCMPRLSKSVFESAYSKLRQQKRTSGAIKHNSKYSARLAIAFKINLIGVDSHKSRHGVHICVRLVETVLAAIAGVLALKVRFNVTTARLARTEFAECLQPPSASPPVAAVARLLAIIVRISVPSTVIFLNCWPCGKPCAIS